MDGLLGQSDGLIRLLAFAAVFLLMAAIELIRPKRRLSVSKPRRWLTNLGIAGVDTLVLRLMAALTVPVAAVAAAFFAKERGLGLLNQVDWPYWVTLMTALLALALAILWKIVVVIPLGASPFAVFLFEVILNACAMFNHANIALPAWLDRALRLFIVTPDMHRVHHSVLRREHDRNYGFNLSLWDRLFGTYLSEPEAGQLGMTIGLPPYQSEAPTRLG